MTPTVAPPASQPALTEQTSMDCWQARQFCSVTVPHAEPTAPGTEAISIQTCFVDQGTPSTHPPLLFLHGFDGSLLEFRRLLPLLTPDRRVIAVDLLGFGFSERSPPLPPNPSHLKQHLAAFWEQQINEPVTLVGVSMGGAAALDFTLSFSERVKHLILIDSAGLANQPVARWLMVPPVDRWLTQFLASPKVRQNISQTAYYDKQLASEDARACCSAHLVSDRWSEGLIAFTKSGGYGNYRQQLARLTLPSLVIWGKQDKILGTKAAQQFVQGLPQSELVWLDRCGHVPHLEQPAATAQAIRQFLAKMP